MVRETRVLIWDIYIYLWVTPCSSAGVLPFADPTPNDLHCHATIHRQPEITHPHRQRFFLVKRGGWMGCGMQYSKSMYPSSHNHGSVENGCISNISFLSFRVVFHFNDYGRKGKSWTCFSEKIFGFCIPAYLKTTKLSKDVDVLKFGAQIPKNPPDPQHLIFGC